VSRPEIVQSGTTAPSADVGGTACAAAPPPDELARTPDGDDLDAELEPTRDMRSSSAGSQALCRYSLTAATSPIRDVAGASSVAADTFSATSLARLRAGSPAAATSRPASRQAEYAAAGTARPSQTSCHPAGGEQAASPTSPPTMIVARRSPPVSSSSAADRAAAARRPRRAASMSRMRRCTSPCRRRTDASLRCRFIARACTTDGPEPNSLTTAPPFRGAPGTRAHGVVVLGAVVVVRLGRVAAVAVH